MPRPTRRDPPRVRHDLDLMAQTLLRRDPGIRSIVLTGSFARGEGGLLDGVPQNDYDLLVLRRAGEPRPAYAPIRRELEELVGVEVDLAAMPAWRLWLAPRTVFWYETALRGRVLAGEDLRGRIACTAPGRIDSREGVRLLVNRAAGLLFATAQPAPGAVRLQAAKAILAACDALLLACGRFAPSQSERRILWLAALARHGEATPLPALSATAWWDWAEWAFTVKVDPGRAEPRPPGQAWAAARSAILAVLPAALRAAGCRSLADYARRDSLAEQAVWLRRSAAVPGALRLRRHATGTLREATLRMLAGCEGAALGRDAPGCLARLVRMGAAPGGRVAAEAARADGSEPVLQRLRLLRAATLQ